jgi:hypothetical protein
MIKENNYAHPAAQDKPLELQSLLPDNDDYPDCRSRVPGHKNVCIISEGILTCK